MENISDIEVHPWPPFIPEGAKVLIMGTFPPGNHRWSFDFYYPNRTNDFWYMMGLIFYGDKNYLLKEDKTFNLQLIKSMLAERHIALNDTGKKVRRLKGNASDKFLEIVEPVNLTALLARMPQCNTVVTTGEKAAGVVAALTGTLVPKMGEMVISTTGLEIWRMPSTSRAYPMSLANKAEYYSRVFRHCGILSI